MRKIKTGDKVKVMRGKEAGKEGEVLSVVRKQNKKGKIQTKVVVRDVNVVTRHQKPNPILNTPGGIVKVEKPIDISNVMLVDSKAKNKVTRVGFGISKTKDKKKTRISKKSGTKI